MFLAYFNPYTGATFWEFFIQLLSRMGQFLSGHLRWNDLATDEIQILVLVGSALSATLVGSFLMLRKMTMLANSLSHTILLGIVVAYLLIPSQLGSYDPKIMLLAAMITGIVTAFCGEFLTKVARLPEDASTGIVFTTLFAIGIILVTLATRDAHIGTEVVMGNVDALNKEDSYLVYIVLAINAVVIFLFFKEFLLTTFDPGLARGLGINSNFFNYLLVGLASLTVVSAFRAVGVLMVLALITGPAMTARLISNDLRGMLGWASFFGVLACLIGVALSRHLYSVYGLALSTAGLVVCVVLFQYLVVLTIIHYFKLTYKRKQLY